jgi:hypothetical protein
MPLIVTAGTIITPECIRWINVIRNINMVLTIDLHVLL